MSLNVLSYINSDILLVFSRIPYTVWILSLVTLQYIFRRRGHYYYRYFLAALIVFIAGFNGLIASIFLPWFGLESYINVVAARTCYLSTKYFLGINSEIEGEENYNPEIPCVLITNHQTLVDIAVYGHICGPGAVTVPKKALKRIPLFGWYLTRGQSIWIDRSSQSKTLATMAQAAIDINIKKITPYIFPEGTRNNKEEYDFLPFKKGAFHLAKQAGVPILPIVIDNYHDIVSTKHKWFKYGTIIVKILPRVYLDDVENNHKGINKITEDVRNLMLTEYKMMEIEKKKSI